MVEPEIRYREQHGSVAQPSGQITQRYTVQTRLRKYYSHSNTGAVYRLVEYSLCSVESSSKQGRN